MRSLSALALHEQAPVDGWTDLLSQLRGVPDAAWKKFVTVLATNDEGRLRKLASRNPSGGLGCFNMRVKRLVDLGLMRSPRLVRESGRQIFVGEFVEPLTEARFLTSALVQYNALVTSLQRYDADIVPCRPDGMSRSGALALLHRCGPSGLISWERRKLPSTARLFALADNLF